MEENMQQGNANNFWLNFSTYFLNKSFVKLHNIFSNELMFVTILFYSFNHDWKFAQYGNRYGYWGAESEFSIG